MGLLDVADRIWPVSRHAVGLHTKVYRLTGGRIGHQLPGMAKMLLLDHTGARTGAARTTPLVYAEDGPNLLIIASKGGYPKHPAWYHNLLAHPDTSVQVGAERRAVRARVAGDDERPRLWARALEAYPGFDNYQERTDRTIPVVVLEPRPA
jgi:deazaflavin-dependent oxidoreductase (nitroreductase family)